MYHQMPAHAVTQVYGKARNLANQAKGSLQDFLAIANPKSMILKSKSTLKKNRKCLLPIYSSSSGCSKRKLAASSSFLSQAKYA